MLVPNKATISANHASCQRWLKVHQSTAVEYITYFIKHCSIVMTELFTELAYQQEEGSLG